MRWPTTTLLSVSVLCALSGCGGPEEAQRVALPMVLDASGLNTVTTDLGYQVALDEVRLVVENFAFAIAGEAHTASLMQRVGNFLVPSAYAHPGHYQGGDVTGELRGRFVLDWLPGANRAIGTANLLVGNYQSANFTFAMAQAADGVAADDPLLGHTAILRGRASKAGVVVAFTVLIDSPADRELVGVPAEFELSASSTAEMRFRLDLGGTQAGDAQAGDTLFDGVDFTALDVDGDGNIRIEATATEPAVVDAYNLLRRTLQTHDHYELSVAPVTAR